MKLHLMSDTHHEHYADHSTGLLGRIACLSVPRADALVLAGDITATVDIARWQEDMEDYLALYPKVIYVPGNHEFYGNSGPAYMDAMRLMAANLGHRFTMLDHQCLPLEFMGHRFLGGTMWFKPTSADWRWSRHVGDFRHIKDFVPWVHDENHKFTQYMTDNLKEGDIVVTHHLPSERSTPPQFANAPTNRYFVYNMEPLIKFRKPSLWMHGHTHQAFDYKIDDTRIVCNPRGYPGELYKRDGLYMPYEVEI
jgi:predicted phosphodiesterase